MKTKLLNLWEALHSSFWFVPTLMLACAMGLGIVLPWLDQHGMVMTDGLWWVYSRGAGGARSILETIAGSMMTVASLVFSITIVALQLASSQFGPRLLYNFRRDTSNQLVLGTFISTFVYCLLVLRTIQGEGNLTDVPQVSVIVGILLALASLGVLIYFIHHIAASIQADNVVAKVGAELHETISRMFPSNGRASSEVQSPSSASSQALEGRRHAITASSSGHVQSINITVLAEVASNTQGVVEVLQRPGRFVMRGEAVASLRTDRAPDQTATASICAAFTLGSQRTNTQDVGFGFNQLVEIAMRAMSPGINDSFTALRCLNELGAALCYLVQRPVPSPYCYDGSGELRVIAPSVSLAEIIEEALGPLRRNARTNVMVTSRLLEIIALVSERCNNAGGREALRRQVMSIHRGVRETSFDEHDQELLEVKFQSAAQALVEGRHVHSGAVRAPERSRSGNDAALL